LETGKSKKESGRLASFQFLVSSFRFSEFRFALFLLPVFYFFLLLT